MKNSYHKVEDVKQLNQYLYMVFRQMFLSQNLHQYKVS